MTSNGTLNNCLSTEVDETEIQLRDPAFLISLLVPTVIGLYLLITSTTTLPEVWRYDIWPYDIKRILQFSVLFLLCLTPLINGRIRNELSTQLSIIPTWLTSTLGFVFFWGIASALVNAQSFMHALNSLSEVILLSTIALGIFILAACRRIAGNWFDRIGISLLTLTGLTVGAQELLGAGAIYGADVQFNFRFALLNYSWPRFYNQVQSWMIPALCILPLLFTRNRLAALLCLITLSLQWYIILMTGARGSFVSLFAALAFSVAFIPQLRSRLLRWQLSGFFIGTFIFVLVLYGFESSDSPVASGNTPHTLSQSHSRTEDLPEGKRSFFGQSVGKPMMNTSGRTELWSTALQDTVENPLLGIGPMNYACTSTLAIGHPHNFPLQLSAEWGIPVALAACVVFIFLLFHMTRSIRGSKFKSSKDTEIAGLLFTGVLAAALHSCLSGVMVMPASQVTGLLICGMLLGLVPIKHKKESGAAIGLIVTISVFLSAGLVILGAYELKTMGVRKERMLSMEVMHPRHWQNSKVCALYNLQNEVKN